MVARPSDRARPDIDAGGSPGVEAGGKVGDMGTTSRFAVIGGLLGGATLATGLVAPWFFQPRTLVRALRERVPDILSSVETDRATFALTFDDGPHPPYTEAVLDLLAEHEARATFFLIGEQIEAHPHLVRRIIDEGHEVANHFYDDRPTATLSNQLMIESLERCEALLDGQNEARLVRPASAFIRPDSLALLRERGYTVVLGSAYCSDPANPPRAYMRWAFRQMLEAGRIVVLHDGRGDRQRTVDVLPDILQEAQRQGLEPGTVSALLAGAESVDTP